MGKTQRGAALKAFAGYSRISNFSRFEPGSFEKQLNWW